MSKRTKPTELQRAYDVANASFNYYDGLVKMHQNNLYAAQQRLKKAEKFKEKCELKALEYNIKLELRTK